jgi:hypothetical protein
VTAAANAAAFALSSVVGRLIPSKPLVTEGLTPEAQRAELRGIADEVTVYEIP